MKKIFYTACALCALTTYSFAEEGFQIIPGEKADGFDVAAVLERYKRPCEKYGEAGFLIQDRALDYTIDKSCLASCAFGKYKADKGLHPFEMLLLLSENHWIALNKRDLKLAKSISEEMKLIMLGKYGIHQEDFSSVELLKEILNRRQMCIEQVEMSDRKDQKFDAKTAFAPASSDDLGFMNALEFACMYDIAKMMTNTPLMSQITSYDLLNSEDLSFREPTKVICKQILGKYHDVYTDAVGLLKAKYPELSGLVDLSMKVREASYFDYLDHVIKVLRSTPMRAYKPVDRGQTSGGHRNTCAFNSIFYADVAMKNLASTKQDSLIKGRDYVVYLQNLWKGFPSYEKHKADLPISDMPKRMTSVLNNGGAEASYSLSGEIVSTVGDPRKLNIFGGILSDASLLEMQCHQMMLNMIIFSKTRVMPGDSLLSYYGVGYFGSDVFPIAPISCNLYHAQSLVRS